MKEAELDRIFGRLIRSAIQYHPEVIFDLIATRMNKQSWTVNDVKLMNKRINESDKTVSKFLEDL